MSKQRVEQPQFAKTAGKISILAALAGVAAFMFALMVDVGQQEIKRVSAQGTATTTLTVLNTPPFFTQGAYEVVESTSTSPTNSGTTIEWAATGEDSNGAPYFLLVCSTNASPTANPAADAGSLGTAPPECGAGAVQWGVSTSTISGNPASVSTTTVEGGQFAETNDWFAWVCDDDPVQAACVVVPVQGLSATNSSPFNMNRRPVLTNFFNDGPIDPGATINFLSTSTDPDVVGGEDTLTLVVCQDNTSFSTTTDTCTSQIATSTFNPLANATSSYLVGGVSGIVQDGTYETWGYLIDSHGHEATAPFNFDFVVNNVPPTLSGGDIDLNGGADIALINPSAGETTGFTLEFELSDANSCINSGGATSSEITGYEVAVFRSGVGTTSCDAASADYDPNSCYTSGVDAAVWNLACTASTTSCTGVDDDTQVFSCDFPLWFVADPTDAGATVVTDSPFEAEYWSASVRGVDDNFATGTQATNTSQIVDLLQAPFIDLQTAEIPYGALAPGENSGLMATSTTVLNIGNTGLDQEVSGESMCGTFSVATECVNDINGTIPEVQQRFSSTSVVYSTLTNPDNQLSSTTPKEVELDLLKPTGTTTLSLPTGDTYWGIAVPGSITVAGSYEGLNTFMQAVAETADWTP